MYGISLFLSQIIIAAVILMIPIIIYMTSEGAQKFIKKSSSAISGVQLKKVNVLTNKNSLFGKLFADMAQSLQVIGTSKIA